jgi:hypothetical protein
LTKCQRSKKRRYKSKGAAQRAADIFTARHNKLYSVYRCQHCNGLHLFTVAKHPGIR